MLGRFDLVFMALPCSRNSIGRRATAVHRRPLLGLDLDEFTSAITPHRVHMAHPTRIRLKEREPATLQTGCIAVQNQHSHLQLHVRHHRA